VKGAADAVTTEIFDDFIASLFSLGFYQVSDYCDPGAAPDAADRFAEYLF